MERGTSSPGSLLKRPWCPVTDNVHIHRLRVAVEKALSPSTPIFVRSDDLKYALDRLDHLQKSIEEFVPTREGDADWKDEALNV